MASNNLRYTVYLCSIFLIISFQLNAQVGIGTTSPDPSAALDITSPGSNSGVLFPRMTTAQRNAISSPAAGLLIYNTDVNQLQYNFGDAVSSNWVSIKDAGSIPRSVKYSFDDSANNPNLNRNAGRFVSFFVTEDWNDDTTLYTRNNNTTLTVNEAGRYRIVANIDMRDVNASTNFIALTAQVDINGTLVGTRSSTGIFTQSGGGENTFASFNFEEVLELSAGDTVRVFVDRAAQGGTIRLSGSNFTNILIEKIE